jgi:hypothetical protein
MGWKEEEAGSKAGSPARLPAPHYAGGVGRKKEEAGLKADCSQDWLPHNGRASKA